MILDARGVAPVFFATLLATVLAGWSALADDPCPSRNWTLVLNHQNASSKSDLLMALDLLSDNPNVSVNGLLTVPRDDGTRGRFLHFAFNMNGPDSAQSLATLTSRLSQLRGISAHCRN